MGTRWGDFPVSKKSHHLLPPPPGGRSLCPLGPKWLKIDAVCQTPPKNWVPSASGGPSVSAGSPGSGPKTMNHCKKKPVRHPSLGNEVRQTLRKASLLLHKKHFWKKLVLAYSGKKRRKNSTFLGKRRSASGGTLVRASPPPQKHTFFDICISGPVRVPDQPLAGPSDQGPSGAVLGTRRTAPEGTALIRQRNPVPDGPLLRHPRPIPFHVVFLETYSCWE